MPLAAYYSGQVASCSRSLQNSQRRILWIAIFRLLSFIVAGAGIYLFIRNRDTGVAVLALFSITAFFLLLKWNFRLNDQRNLLQKLLFINNNELNVLNNLPNNFGSGEHYLTDESYLNDIDVFGKQSLFHLLNRTTTSHGEQQLANLLQRPLLSKDDIESYQEAIHILSQQTDTRQSITAYGLLHTEKEGNLHQIGSWLDTSNVLHNAKWISIIRWVVPPINVAALFYYWSTDNLIPLGLSIFASWCFTGLFIRYISDQHTLLGKKQAILDQYASILKVFTGVQTAQSDLLQQMHATSLQAYASTQKLSQLSGLLDHRLNLVVNIFLNSFLLYDIQCLFALEKWKIKNKQFFNQWIECVGNIETLNSLAGFSSNNPQFVRPAVIEQHLIVEAKGLAHPLIPARERIANDVELGRSSKLALITGSNMSGKTTFLRTIGVNLLLAQCGAPVCATSFSFTPMQLLTAIRISDSLQQHTSYFMAELRRLQHIIQFLGSGKPALVLVDEILRGTNSDDKTHGSEEFIKKVVSFNCLTLFATHDLSLSKLEHALPGIVANYCFESNIQHDDLYFDYQLKRGIAQNKNASFLMRKMDII
jgi:DNA mismatch repair ATPase MutS